MLKHFCTMTESWWWKVNSTVNPLKICAASVRMLNILNTSLQEAFILVLAAIFLIFFWLYFFDVCWISQENYSVWQDGMEMNQTHPKFLVLVTDKTVIAKHFEGITFTACFQLKLLSVLRSVQVLPSVDILWHSFCQNIM